MRTPIIFSHLMLRNERILLIKTLKDIQRKKARENHRKERPNPDWTRGSCPECGDCLVSELRVVPGQKPPYQLVWECWSAQGESPTCTFKRIL